MNINRNLSQMTDQNLAEWQPNCHIQAINFGKSFCPNSARFQPQFGLNSASRNLTEMDCFDQCDAKGSSTSINCLIAAHSSLLRLILLSLFPSFHVIGSESLDMVIIITLI